MDDRMDSLAESAITKLASYIQDYLGKPKDSNSYVSDNKLYSIVQDYIRKEIQS